MGLIQHDKKYYVYELIDPRNNKPFYVGKGQRNRIYDHERNVIKNDKIPNGNKKLFYKIRKILKEELEIIYKKLFQTGNETEAYEFEKKIIKEYGLKNLCNILPGGIGAISGKDNHCYGIKRSKETIKKISSALMGVTLEVRFGKEKADLMKKKMSEVNKGKTYEEMYGKEEADKIKKIMSKKMKGRDAYWVAECRKGKSYKEIYGEDKYKEEIEKRSGINNGFYGKTHSEEFKKKISINTTKRLKGKTYIELYGVKKAKEIKMKQSLSAQKRQYKEERF